MPAFRSDQAIAAALIAHKSTIEDLERQAPTILQIAQILSHTLRSGGKLLICGNGGSAADAQHFAAELVGRFENERMALAAIALTTNTSTLTALGNDYSYDVVFARQVEAIGKPGDVLIGISTSGRSKNIILAVERAQDLGLVTVGLTGRNGGELKAMVDYYLSVGDRTSRTQEAHILAIHLLCELVEAQL